MFTVWKQVLGIYDDDYDAEFMCTALCYTKKRKTIDEHRDISTQTDIRMAYVVGFLFPENYELKHNSLLQTLHGYSSKNSMLIYKFTEFSKI